MTGLDWLLLTIVAVSALLGLMRGFVAVVLSLLAWALAGAAAYWFGGDAAVMLSDDSTPSAGWLVGGYVLSFAGVMVAVMVLSWLVRRVLQSIGLSGLDRALGLAFGLLRGMLFACVLVLLMGFTSMPREPQWRSSQTMPVFEPGARWLRSLLPAAMARQVDFDAGGPISDEALRGQEARLQPLIEQGGAAAQDSGDLLRALGGAKDGDVARLVPGAQGKAPDNPHALPEPVHDPAAVDTAPVRHDPAAVDGPAARRTP